MIVMKFQTLKGMRDFGPAEAMKKQKALDAIRRAFERYGFAPMDTPALESFDMLSMKGGGDAIRREIYNFKDQGGREIGLRFDLTVPLARFMADNVNLPKPFKRYAIGDVWRYDNPQASRWRQFTQADVDIIGSPSINADAECVAAIIAALEGAGLKDFRVRINNRKLLEDIILGCGVQKEKIADIFRTIDKLDKIGKEGVEKELKNAGVDAKKMFSYLEKSISGLSGFEGYEEVQEFLRLMKVMGLDGRIKTDLSLVRGLEYYTGNVFEVSSSSSVSIAGGGRYDKMMTAYGAGNLPAVGVSIGVDRLLELLDSDEIKTPAKVFVAVIGDARGYAVKIAKMLRENGVNACIELGNRNIKKQLEYADSLKIPYIVIVGPEEMKNGTAKVRNMAARKEESVKISELANLLR